MDIKELKRPVVMVEVTQEDANNYCEVLRVLGMEEEGDPVAEIKRLRAELDLVQQQRNAGNRRIEQLTDELAASQAREKVLRDALVEIGDSACGEACHQYVALRALALPADDTALREMLARAQEEMRERCIEEVRGVGGIDAIEVERLIRALEVKP